MTVICAVVNDNGSYIAGDRGASDDNIILPLAHPKVWQIGQYLFGYYGSMDGEKVMYNFDPPVPTAAQRRNIDKFMGNEFTKALKEFYDEHFVFTSEKECDFGMIIIAEGKMYVKPWRKKQEIDQEVIDHALDWLCPFCETFTEVDFYQLVEEFNHNANKKQLDL